MLSLQLKVFSWHSQNFKDFPRISKKFIDCVAFSKIQGLFNALSTIKGLFMALEISRTFQGSLKNSDCVAFSKIQGLCSRLFLKFKVFSLPSLKFKDVFEALYKMEGLFKVGTTHL
jgi:hypothetical protein